MGSLIYRKRKVDKNQKEIIKCFESLGCSVADLSSVGEGVSDLVVGCRGSSHLVEIKNGSNLTKSQIQFKSRWEGDYSIVRSITDVVNLVEKWRLK